MTKTPKNILTITKTYKNQQKTIIYKRSWKKPRSKTPEEIEKMVQTRKDNQKNTEYNKEGDKLLRSINRAKTNIADIISCNSFEYFVTLTIDPKNKYKVDRYDYDSSSKAIIKWLRSNCSKYILVPEKHKDGAFHFHLLANLNKEDLIHFKKNIYNIKTYKLGYTTAKKIQLGSEERIANYMRKYITKQLIKTVGFNKKRYWCSRGLKRPVITYNKINFNYTNRQFDLFRSGAKLVFSTVYFDIWQSPILKSIKFTSTISPLIEQLNYSLSHKYTTSQSVP